MRAGVTSTHIRTQYQSSPDITRRGTPRQDPGSFASDQRTYLSVFR